MDNLGHLLQDLVGTDNIECCLLGGMVGTDDLGLLLGDLVDMDESYQVDIEDYLF